MELLQKLFLNLVKEAKNNGINEKEVLNYLGIQESSQFIHILSQDDLLDSQESLIEAWSNLPSSKISNSQLLANSLSQIVIQEMLVARKSKWNLLAEQIKNYIKTQEITNKKFAEKILSREIIGGMTEADLCKLLKKLSKITKNPPSFHDSTYEKIATIEKIINQSPDGNNPPSSIDHLDIYFYLKGKFPNHELTPKEIKNLLGNYIAFNRTNYIDNDRLVSISNFYFLRDKKNSSVIKFYFISSDSDRAVYYNEGIVIRDTEQSIKLIGYKTSCDNESVLSIVSLAFSISKTSLEKGKKYINGGLFDREDADNKPYHTWIHLSKVNNLDKINDVLDKTKQKTIKHSNFHLDIHSFMIIKAIAYLGQDNELTKLLNKELMNNHYPELPTEYIFDKLFLTGDIPKQQL